MPVDSKAVFPIRSYHEVREALLARREIALLDVREEDPHAQAHPLFAANLPFGRIEPDAYTRLPRRDVPIVVLDGARDWRLPRQAACASSATATYRCWTAASKAGAPPAVNCSAT
jgi:hypothetical protein